MFISIILLVSELVHYSDFLCVFSGYEMNPSSIRDGARVLTYHHYVEACKFANGAKQFIKDPKFSSATVCRLMIYSQTCPKHFLMILSSLCLTS